MRPEIKQGILAAQVVLCLLWPLTATAASITFGDKMTTIPVLAVVMTLLLSTLAGVTALLHALKKEYEENNRIDRLWLFVTSKLFGSNMAGMLMFFGAEYWDMSEAAEAAAICLAAFGGGPLIERAVSHFADKYLSPGVVK
jgi:hypothetical protein